jgi:ribonuclease P protein component
LPNGTRYFFPAEHKIKKRRDFLTVKKNGHLLRCPYFLVILNTRTSGPTRLGVTVTRKIGGAVVRNRIKRYLREFFRLKYQKLPASTDISIIGLRGVEKLSFSDIQRELQSIFSL